MITTKLELVEAQTGSPEWARLPKPGHRLEGIGRTLIYDLIASGAVRSASLRRPGNIRGMRLVHLPSLRAYLNGMAEEQLQELAQAANSAA